MLRAILFDHDGTLVDSEASHCKIWNALLSGYGASVSFAEFARDCIGVPVDKTTGYFIERFSLNITVAELVAIKERAALEYQQEKGFPAIVGAMELLRELHGMQLKVAIVSGAMRDSVLNTVACNGLASMLGAVVTASDVAVNKPAPDGYLQALDRLGVTADEAVAIEDSASGIASAKAAGLTCLAIHHDYISRSSLASADWVFNTHAEVREHLLNLIGTRQ
jgi:HAD superfamily hydrolase (TIGR01509 family)|tara:strand:+ start:5096 stop:5761 length:666 start_codon:yes stop_codon:yes gene_type:complete